MCYLLCVEIFLTILSALIDHLWEPGVLQNSAIFEKIVVFRYFNISKRMALLLGYLATLKSSVGAENLVKIISTQSK